MGRAERFQDDLTQEIRDSANKLLSVVNPLLEELEFRGVTLDEHPKTGCYVSSGWRPPAINASIVNAAPRSKHMTGHAIDLYDPDGDMDEFLFANQNLLQKYGLYMEHPLATKGWCHLQDIAPKSGNIVFYP